jgi:hypothetical protein
MALNAELTVGLDATWLVEGFSVDLGSSGSLNAIASPADPDQLSSAPGSGGSLFRRPSSTHHRFAWRGGVSTGCHTAAVDDAH